jgi:hypothetical protein
LKVYCLLILFFVSFWAHAQRVKGTINAVNSNEALAYATVEINGLNKDYTKYTYADRNGAFKANLTQGEYTIQISYTGYENLLDTITIDSKETLTIIFELNELPISNINPIITANLIPESNTLLINKSNFLKLAGSFNDPSRLLTKFPGIAATNDQSNFISLLGMPPSMAGWFINGASVVNPNHLSNTGTFTDQSSPNGGGVNMISGNSIAEFRFVQSPLNGEYFNIGSGLSDFTLDIPKGLNFSIGLLGTEIKYGYEKEQFKFGLNYRYSTLGILSSIGVPLGDEKINFQDFHTRIERNGKSFRFSFDLLFGGNSNIHDPLEEVVFFKDALFIGLTGRQEIASIRYDVYKNKWRLDNTFNYSSRNSNRQITATEDVLGYEIDSLESVQELRVSTKNVFKYFIDNNWEFNYSNNYEIGQINFRDKEGLYQRGAGIANIKYRKRKFLVEGGIGVSFIGRRNLAEIGNDNKVGSESRFLLQYGNNKNRVSGRVSTGFVSVLPEIMILGSKSVPMETINMIVDYVHEGKWGKMKIGGYYHRFNNVLISENARVSYFSRFDLVEDVVNTGDYTSDGEASIIGGLIQYQKEYKNLQFVTNYSLYDLEISDNIIGDYNFNYTYSATLSYSKKVRDNQLLISSTLQGRGANNEFNINLEESRNQGTTIYNRMEVQRLTPYSRLDFKLSYSWGKTQEQNNKYLLSIDILNLLNRRNDSYSFYDALADEIILNNQLGLIPILKFEVNLF